MKNITPYLWYNKEAKEAAELYIRIFKGSRILHASTLEGTPSGSVDMVQMEILGQEIHSMSAVSHFQLNPSISFMVFCPSIEEVETIWKELSPGGNVLMELGEYPFSPRYGWLNDRYGLSWQIIFSPEGERKITPSFLFVGDVCGKAEEAIRFYTSIFPNSGVGELSRYGEGALPDSPESLNYGAFQLAGQNFIVMDSAHDHKFSFNEAFSFMINCDSQKEIDYYWEKLSAVPEAEQCGWVKDKFGVSWQIVPTEMREMMSQGSREQIKRVTQAFLQMKKFDLEELRRAYRS